MYKIFIIVAWNTNQINKYFCKVHPWTLPMYLYPWRGPSYSCGYVELVRMKLSASESWFCLFVFTFIFAVLLYQGLRSRVSYLSWGSRWIHCGRLFGCCLSSHWPFVYVFFSCIMIVSAQSGWKHSFCSASLCANLYSVITAKLCPIDASFNQSFNQHQVLKAVFYIL